MMVVKAHMIAFHDGCSGAIMYPPILDLWICISVRHKILLSVPSLLTRNCMCKRADHTRTHQHPRILNIKEHRGERVIEKSGGVQEGEWLLCDGMSQPNVGCLLVV